MTLCDPMTVAYQSPPSMGFSRQEYWNGLPFRSPGDLPDQGSNPGLLYCRQVLFLLSHQVYDYDNLGLIPGQGTKIPHATGQLS